MLILCEADNEPLYQSRPTSLDRIENSLSRGGADWKLYGLDVMPLAVRTTVLPEEYPPNAEYEVRKIDRRDVV